MCVCTSLTHWVALSSRDNRWIAQQFKNHVERCGAEGLWSFRLLQGTKKKTPEAMRSSHTFDSSMRPVAKGILKQDRADLFCQVMIVPSLWLSGPSVHIKSWFIRAAAQSPVVTYTPAGVLWCQQFQSKEQTLKWGSGRTTFIQPISIGSKTTIHLHTSPE